MIKILLALIGRVCLNLSAVFTLPFTSSLLIIDLFCCSQRDQKECVPNEGNTELTVRSRRVEKRASNIARRRATSVPCVRRTSITSLFDSRMMLSPVKEIIECDPKDLPHVPATA